MKVDWARETVHIFAKTRFILAGFSDVGCQKVPSVSVFVVNQSSISRARRENYSSGAM